MNETARGAFFFPPEAQAEALRIGAGCLAALTRDLCRRLGDGSPPPRCRTAWRPERETNRWNRALSPAPRRSPLHQTTPLTTLLFQLSLPPFFLLFLLYGRFLAVLSQRGGATGWLRPPSVSVRRAAVQTERVQRCLGAAPRFSFLASADERPASS